jgi:signal transduction histidine kinase
MGLSPPQPTIGCVESPGPDAALFQRLGLLAMAAAAAIGASALAGWLFHVEVLKRVLPNQIAMNPATAVALILLSISSILFWARTRQRWTTPFAIAAASIPIAIAVAKICYSVAGWEGGIDRAFLASYINADPGAQPSRMAPNTAVACLLLGLSLLCVRFRPKWSAAAAVVSLGIGALALIPYMYAVDASLGIASLTAMAFHTALAVILLSTAVLVRSWESGLLSLVGSPYNGGRTLRRLLPGVAVVVLGMGWLRLQGARAGLYSDDFGVVLIAGGTLGLLAILCWIVCAELDRADRRFRESRNALTAAQSALQLKHELLSAVVDSVNDGIFAVNARGEVLLSNAAFQSLRPPGVRPVGEGEADAPDALEASLRDAAAGRTVSDREQSIPGPDGPRWISITAQPLRGETGAAVATIRDITARKHAVLRLEEDKGALEEAVQARTTYLKRSNQELEQFAYVASHDLQEPLRMVGSYLQLLERRYADKLDHQAREFIAFAVDGAARMKRLINDLLQYSRVDRKGGRFAVITVRECVDDALANLAAAAEGVEIAIGDLPEISADGAQLRQLFQNLLGNAMKFRAGSSPRIRVEAARASGEWAFSITDNGIGLEPRFAERIFEIFQRLHSREQYPGTGIGLAICKKIVERHGGRIWVESTGAGQGATFRFTIPDQKGTSHEQRRAA